MQTEVNRDKKDTSRYKQRQKKEDTNRDKQGKPTQGQVEKTEKRQAKTDSYIQIHITTATFIFSDELDI